MKKIRIPITESNGTITYAEVEYARSFEYKGRKYIWHRPAKITVEQTKSGWRITDFLTGACAGSHVSQTQDEARKLSINLIDSFPKILERFLKNNPVLNK